MDEPYFIAFWSSTLDCWVVCHRLAGTTQLAVDVEGLHWDGQVARAEARRMNLDRYRALGQEAAYRRLLGCRA